MSDWFEDLGSFSAVFAAGLTGLVASPILELLRSRISERSSKRKLREETVQKLRIAVGYLDAIEELVDRTFGERSTHLDGFSATGSVSWASVKAFDLTAVYKLIEDITRLDVKQSASSAAGQSLTRRLLITLSAFEKVKTFEPLPVRNSLKSLSGDREYSRKFALTEDDQIALTFALDSLAHLKFFLLDIYAPRLGISGLTFSADSEIYGDYIPA